MKRLILTCLILVAGFGTALWAQNAWYFNDSGMQGWGQNYNPPDRWEWMDAGPLDGPSPHYTDLDPNNPYYACSNPIIADYSGLPFFAEIFFGNNYQGYSQSVTVELYKGNWMNPPAGAALASATVSVTHYLNDVGKYWFDFGVIPSLVLNNECLILKITTVASPANTHIFWDALAFRSALHQGVPGYNDPTLDIEIDDLDGPVSFSSSKSVKMTISLNPKGQAGVRHDWWLWGMRNGTQQWWYTYSGNWSGIQARAYNGKLITVNDYLIHQGPIPVGSWEFAFVIDAFNNVYEQTYLDVIDVTVY
jgi:hypothetical protein